MRESVMTELRNQVDDLFLTFGEIHSTSEAMKKQILEIARHQVIREVARDWLDCLRFVVICKFPHLLTFKPNVWAPIT